MRITIDSIILCITAAGVCVHLRGVRIIAPSPLSVVDPFMHFSFPIYNCTTRTTILRGGQCQDNDGNNNMMTATRRTIEMKLKKKNYPFIAVIDRTLYSRYYYPKKPLSLSPGNHELEKESACR